MTLKLVIRRGASSWGSRQRDAVLSNRQHDKLGMDTMDGVRRKHWTRKPWIRNPGSRDRWTAGRGPPTSPRNKKECARASPLRRIFLIQRPRRSSCFNNNMKWRPPVKRAARLAQLSSLARTHGTNTKPKPISRWGVSVSLRSHPQTSDHLPRYPACSLGRCHCN